MTMMQDPMIQHEAFRSVAVDRLVVSARPEVTFQAAARESIIIGMLHWTNVELRHDGQAYRFVVNDLILRAEISEADET